MNPFHRSVESTSIGWLPGQLMLAVLAGAAALILLGSTATAEMIPLGNPPETLPALEISMKVPGHGFVCGFHTSRARDSAETSFRYRGSHTLGPISVAWDIEADPDPLLYATFYHQQ